MSLLSLLPSCDFFTTTPFPGYIGNLISETTIGDKVKEIFGKDQRVLYDFIAVETKAGTSHLFLLITPRIGVLDSEAPKPALLYFTDDGRYQGKVPSGGSTVSHFFSKPFGVDINDNILAGRILLDPANVLNINSRPPPKKLAHSHAGHIVRSTPNTYLVSGTGGSNGSFELRVSGYDNSYGIIKGADQPVNIIPSSEHPSQNDLANSKKPLGYSFHGVMYEGNDIIFLMEYIPQKKLHIWRLATIEFQKYFDLGDATSLKERNSGKPDIDIASSYVYHTDEHIIVRRISGRFERYDTDGKLLDSVIGEKGTGTEFEFTPDGKNMYRYDPDIGKLQYFVTWW